ncbi:TonB-dependent receptor [Sphingomonas sp. SFZ2018-12]|uniref:TonB-dependent receptor n=1 Tax=Sphingomonas sp. SFZ2018-12 TaxID=2683197 RepID=UPI001F0FA61E|nr:TonB-dependent receptor [Sphingomonas sp. SFZ2018-12]MCH4893696.1 TonB-dependent receptor [Sphingomonas sp. SFZ2018-12]
MRTVRTRLIRLAPSLLAMSTASLFWSASAAAQDTPDQTNEAPPAESDDIVVTGIRASIADALNTKRNAANILDSISAQDIGKLPDQNVSETLSRIPGVQITRLEGEGSRINVRGIDLNRTLLNGRNFIGASSNGDPNLNDFPSEILASVDVIKSPSADIIEGWLGAAINLKTRRPLDLKDMLFAGRINGSYGDQSERFGAKGALAVGGQLLDGRLGVLVSTTGSVFNGRTYGLFTRGYSQVNGLTATGPGASAPRLFRPNRIETYDLRYQMERFGLNGTVQFRPIDSLTFTYDGFYSRSETDRTRNANQILFTNNLTNVVALADGTIDQATVNGVTIRPIIFSGPSLTETNAHQLNVNFESGPLTLNVNGSISLGDADGANDGTSGSANYYAGNDFVVVLRQAAGQTASVTYDWSTADAPMPNYNISSNFDVTNPRNFEGFTVVDNNYLTTNRGRDVDFDATYEVDWGFIKSFKVGGRYERQTLEQRVVGRTHTPAELAAGDPTPGDTLRGNEIAGLAYNGQSNTLFEGYDGAFPRTILVGSFDINAFVARFGRNRTAQDLALEQQTLFDVEQDTYAGFAMTTFGGEIAGIELNGNAGVRYVRSERLSRGFSLVNATTTLPVEQGATFNNWLPSANLSARFTPDFQVRLAAAKVIARPPLSLTGVGISFNPTSNTGSAGNPLLDPYAATQYDLSAEWYFAKASLLSVALFKKDVSAFTRTIQVEEDHPEIIAPGTTNSLYIISRPANGSDGKIEGVEFNYFHAFTFLPAPLDGLGLNLSYTYANGSTPNIDEFSGERLSLPNLSKHSYNLVGYYERDGVNLRVAYNYRSKFLSVQQSASQGGSVFQNDYGQLDASASYKISPNFTLTVDAINLTRSTRTLFIGTENRLATAWRDDRRFYFGASFNF